MGLMIPKTGKRRPVSHLIYELFEPVVSEPVVHEFFEFARREISEARVQNASFSSSSSEFFTSARGYEFRVTNFWILGSFKRFTDWGATINKCKFFYAAIASFLERLLVETAARRF